MKLQRELIRMAKMSGACERVRDLEQCTNDNQVIQLLFRHFDFCAHTQFPPPEFLLPYRDMLLANGIYLNCFHTKLTGFDRYALIGSSRCHLTAKAFEAPVVYLKDKTVLHIQAEQHAIVLAEAFHTAALHVATSEMASVIVTLHNQTEITAAPHREGSIKIIDHRHVKK